mmetsp:Transcript_11546/g.22715  ORF Transcript_11546/g.22715 Transcript_11546/m.22715 type:complete len:770 (+) Transcript_11546:2593-4902(+)
MGAHRATPKNEVHVSTPKTWHMINAEDVIDYRHLHPHIWLEVPEAWIKKSVLSKYRKNNDKLFLEILERTWLSRSNGNLKAFQSWFEKYPIEYKLSCRDQEFAGSGSPIITDQNVFLPIHLSDDALKSHTTRQSFKEFVRALKDQLDGDDGSEHCTLNIEHDDSPRDIVILFNKKKPQPRMAKGNMRQEIKDSKSGAWEHRRNGEPDSTASSTGGNEVLFSAGHCKTLSTSHSSCGLGATRPSSGASERCLPQRLALIVANWEYEGRQVVNLSTPRQDQMIIKCALEANGFDASLGRNLDAQRMKDVIKNFAEKAIGMKAGAQVEAVLFYFAGHGVSDSNGNLQLCGVDASSDCKQGILQLKYIQEQFQKIKDSLKIAVFDCCRISTTPPSRINSHELLDFPAIYSTKPFKRALDRVTNDDLQKAVSPFAGSFARNLLDRRNRSIGDAVHKTREEVSRFTSGKQIPQVDSKHFEYLGQLLLHGSITKPFHRPLFAIYGQRKAASPLTVGYPRDLMEGRIMMGEEKPATHIKLVGQRVSVGKKEAKTLNVPSIPLNTERDPLPKSRPTKQWSQKEAKANDCTHGIEPLVVAEKVAMAQESGMSADDLQRLGLALRHSSITGRGPLTGNLAKEENSELSDDHSSSCNKKFRINEGSRTRLASSSRQTHQKKDLEGEMAMQCAYDATCSSDDLDRLARQRKLRGDGNTLPSIDWETKAQKEYIDRIEKILPEAAEKEGAEIPPQIEEDSHKLIEKHAKLQQAINIQALWNSK